MKKTGYFLSAALSAALLTSVSATAVQAQSLELSANAAITTDYVWRGYSQSNEGPAAQAGIDLTYGMFYAGVWGSSIDFDTNPDDKADFEVDLYAGIKPKLGNIEFDLGAIYYTYPGASDDGAEYNFLELKAGASTSFDKLSVGATVYYSPEFFGETGSTWTAEGTAEYALPMDFAISGTYGKVMFNDDSNLDWGYWNVGLSKSFGDHWKLDARYWDTDVDAKDCKTKSGNTTCDERIVGTVSFSF